MKNLITLIALISLTSQATPRCVKELMNDKEVYGIDRQEVYEICKKKINNVG